MYAALITDHAGYWDHYAEGVPGETPEEAIKNAFGWTQYQSHGPGDDILGEPLSALELGSGRGNAVAALASKGIDATGVDISPVQVRESQRRWGHLSGAHFLQCDVLEFLERAGARWDAIYSIWGALWFTDPERLLPLIRRRLSSGGRLVFSHAPAVPGSHGVQGMYGNGFTGRQTWIYRWAYEPGAWCDLLRQHGFTGVSAWVEATPQAGYVGTLIGEATTVG